MPKVVLSLCGGGMRGVFTARFLRNLDDALIAKTGNGVYHHVDMFAGTSIGAMLAAAFSYQKQSGSYVDQMFNERNSKMIMNKSWMDYIFGLLQSRPLYDGKGKRKFINREYDDVKLCSTKKHSMFVGYDVATREALVFKSWEPCDIRLRDILDLGSAAPTYFPSVKTSTGLIGIDGGVVANNPCIIAYSNALKEFGEESEIKVLSIGTGIKNYDEQSLAVSSLHWGAIPWATKGNLIDRILNAPENEVHNVMERLTCSLGHDYYRINPVLEELSMDDTSQRYIDYLKAAADKSWAVHGRSILKMILN